MIKVIITDVDGTLYNSDSKLSDRNRDTLIQAQQCGIRLVVASGRPTSGLLDLAEELEMARYGGLLVSYNGSRVSDCRNMQTVFNQPLKVAEGKAVLEHLKQFDVYPMIDRDRYMYVNNVYAAPIHINGQPVSIIQHEARGGNFLLCEQEDLAQFLDFEVNKILTAGEPEYLKAHYKAMMEPFKDTLSCMFTSAFYFEYTAKDIDKGKALESVLEPMGYSPGEMIAFGDGMNDMSMLRYVGTGVAMGNAVPELKAEAQYITGTNDEDGLASALCHYLPAELSNCGPVL